MGRSPTALRRQTTNHSIESLRSFAPAISMVKAAEPGTGDHRRGWRRLDFHWPPVRCVLIERIVNPVVVMVVHVIANEPPQMLFVQRDHVVESLAAAAAHPNVPQSRFATVPERSCVSAPSRLPSGRQSHRHRISSHGRGWHSDTDKPRERLHAVVAPPTRQSDDE